MPHPFATALVLACTAGAGVAQTTWYVDVNATAPGLGTQVSPYASIQYAIDQSSTVGGDTLLVLPGTYVEQVDTHGKLLTLKSSAGPLATMLTTGLAGVVVRLGNNTGGVATLDGFSVTGSAPSGNTGILARSGRIRRCLVYGTNVAVHSEFDCYVEECTLTGNLTGIHTLLFAGCVIGSNSIVWGNTVDVQDDVHCATFDHCVIATKLNNDGELLDLGGADPRFWDAARLDLRLRPGSSAIDAGNPAAPHDPDGSVIDVGAVTYDASYAPAPTVYCTAKTNSLGCAPAIGASGHASASGAAFSITCANELNNKLGLLFYGLTPQNALYQGGYLCVSSPVRRTPVTDSLGNVGVDDCSGEYTFDFDALLQSGDDPALVAGELVYAQFWSRDPGSSYTTNRSDALSFGIAP